MPKSHKLLSGLMALIFIALSVAHAAIERQTRIGPTSASLNSVGSAVQISSVNAAGTGIRNCLSDLTFTGNVKAVIRVLDGATTSYTVTVTTISGQEYSLFSKHWDEDDMCGSANTGLSVTVTTAASVANVSTVQLNYTGFTHK